MSGKLAGLPLPFKSRSQANMLNACSTIHAPYALEDMSLARQT